MFFLSINKYLQPHLKVKIIYLDGSLRVYGSNKYGQLGSEEVGHKNVKTLYKVALDTKAIDVACGSYHRRVF